MPSKSSQNSSAPLLLLDVDGVISLFGEGLDVRSGGSWLMVDGRPHFLSGAAGGHLRELASTFELTWCTGWEETANDYLPGTLGIPGPLPFLTFPDDHPRTGAHWKLAAIDHHAGRHRALAWIDDAFSEDCLAWATTRPGPTLLVPTQSHRGLTAAETATLRAWAAALPP